MIKLITPCSIHNWAQTSEGTTTGQQGWKCLQCGIEENRYPNAPQPTPATTPADGELLPCPFCGAHSEEIAVYKEIDSAEWFVRCHVCHVETSRADTEAESIADWNRRATPSPGKADADGIKEEWFAGRNVWGSDSESWLAFIDMYEYAPKQLVEWIHDAIK